MSRGRILIGAATVAGACFFVDTYASAVPLGGIPPPPVQSAAFQISFTGPVLTTAVNADPASTSIGVLGPVGSVTAQDGPSPTVSIDAPPPTYRLYWGTTNAGYIAAMQACLAQANSVRGTTHHLIVGFTLPSKIAIYGFSVSVPTSITPTGFSCTVD
jgi:hypothetical protein